MIFYVSIENNSEIVSSDNKDIFSAGAVLKEK